MLGARSKLYSQNVIIMIGVRALSVLISFLYVPLLLRSFDLSDYGVFLTLTSIVGWFVLLDVGLSTGLRNQLTVAVAVNDFGRAKALVSTAYVAILIYTVIISIVFYIVSQYINWATLLNVSQEKQYEMYKLVVIVFGAFCFNFYFGTINTIVSALQVPFYTSIFSLIGQIISFVIVYILVNYFHVSSLFLVSSIVLYVPIIVLIFSSIYLFSTKFKQLAPSFASYSGMYVKEIMSVGLKFFAIQIVTLVVFQTNHFILLHTVGSEAVVQFSLGSRFFEAISVVFTIVVTPVWSASREAFIKKDYDWIKVTVRRMINLSTFIAGVGIILWLPSKWLFEVWLGEENIEISFFSLGLILCFIVLRNYYQCFGYIINGTNLIKAQLVITSAVAAVYIPCAYIAGSNVGMNGVIVVLCITQLINVVWSRYQLNKILTHQAKGIWNA